MTLRHLTIFLTVAQQGSMSGAARALYLSQPTVSQAIGELEKHYNGLLFERLGKKLYLTDRGKLLLPHAEQLVQQFRQVEELMLNQGQSSTLKLGSTITVGTCLTPSVVVALQEHFPEMSVYSYVSNTRDIEEKLLKSELDAAVVEGEILSSDLIVLPVIDDSLVLAVGKKHPFYTRQELTVSDLQGQSFSMRESAAAPGISLKITLPDINCPISLPGKPTVPGYCLMRYSIIRYFPSCPCGSCSMNYSMALSVPFIRLTENGTGSLSWYTIKTNS